MKSSFECPMDGFTWSSLLGPAVIILLSVSTSCSPPPGDETSDGSDGDELVDEVDDEDSEDEIDNGLDDANAEQDDPLLEQPIGNAEAGDDDASDDNTIDDDASDDDTSDDDARAGAAPDEDGTLDGVGDDGADANSEGDLATALAAPATGLEQRATWMINSYRGITIGGSSPNGAEAQKFGWADVLARLAVNPNDPVPIQRFVSLFAAGNVNGAFMPAGAGWILCKHWDKFTPAQRATVLSTVKRRWNSNLTHGTENHFLVRYVGMHLFAQLWPDETGWYDPIGRRSLNSAELRAITRSRLLDTLRSYYNKGYHEHLSPNYLPVHFYPLHALYSCAADPEIKAAADAALTLHVSEMAANFFEGQTIAPYNREAPQQRSLPQRNTALNTHLKATYWLYWAELMNTPSASTATFVSSGASGFGGEARHFAVTSALSDWRPPNILTSLAQGSNILPYTLQSSASEFGEFARGRPAFTSRTVYRDRRFAVGSGNFVTNIDEQIAARSPGLSERTGHEIAYKTLDAQNTITAHHPYWRTNTAHRQVTSPGTFSSPVQSRWLSRSSPFQQNVQHEATVISLFNIPTTDSFQGRTKRDWEEYRNENRDSQGRGLLIQESWVRYPRSIDEIVQSGGWIFLREGETYIAIRPGTTYDISNNDFADMNVVRSAGAKNIVIMDIATIDQFSSFAAFRNAVLSAPLTIDLSIPAVTYRNVRGKTISARWGAFNRSDRIIFSFPTATVNGVAQTMRDPDFVAGRAVIKSAPLTLLDRILTVRLPHRTMTVDWRGNSPVFSGR